MANNRIVLIIFVIALVAWMAIKLLSGPAEDRRGAPDETAAPQAASGPEAPAEPAAEPAAEPVAIALDEDDRAWAMDFIFSQYADDDGRLLPDIRARRGGAPKLIVGLAGAVRQSPACGDACRKAACPLAETFFKDVHAYLTGAPKREGETAYCSSDRSLDLLHAFRCLAKDLDFPADIKSGDAGGLEAFDAACVIFR